MNLAELSKILLEMTVVSRLEHHEMQEGLEKAAVVVETAAKHLIGQENVPAAGPYPAWAPLAQSTIEEKEKLGYTGQVSETDPLLRTGELRESIRHVVGHNEAVVGSDLDKALEQEMGTERIPARHYLGTALYQNAPEVEKILGEHFFHKLVRR
jgi:phage gpG-like protein